MSARVESGEECYRCRAWVSFFAKPPGYRQLCHDCRDLDEDAGEVSHDNLIRCPKCKHLTRVSDSDIGELYEEGEHNVSCDGCDHDFEVSTRVSFSFHSPELIDQPAAQDAQDDIP